MKEGDRIEPTEKTPSSPGHEGARLSARGFLLMLASATSFAGMAVLVGLVHRIQPSVSTVMTSTVRALINLLILVIIAWPHPRSLLGDGRRSLWARGVFGAGGLLCYFGALSRVGVGEAAFLNQTSAVWVALLAPFLLGERGNRWTWLAVAGAMAGVGLLSFPRAGMSHDMLGRVMGAASGLFAAFAYLSVRKAGSSNSPEVVVFYFTLVASAVCLMLLPLEPVVWPHGPGVWAALVGVGICATLGQLFMTRAYQHGSAVAVSIVGYAGPMLASLFGWLLLDQKTDAAGWAGMALILLCGVTLPLARLVPKGVPLWNAPPAETPDEDKR